MNNDLISIIIPIYKVEKYLDKCIISVIEQSYINLEIILIDDGSPDACPAICDGWAKKDNRIVVIHKKNGGLSDARNAGLDVAKGAYIYFLDSDDTITPDAIKKLYLALTKTGADMAVGSSLKMNESKEVLSKFSFKTSERTLEGIDKFVELNQNVNLVVAWNKLYAHKIFTDIRFPKGKINEDEFIAHLTLDKCNKVALLDETTHIYLSREGSIMSAEQDIKRFDCIEGLFNRIEFYIEKKYLLFAKTLLKKITRILLQAYTSLDLKDKKNYERIEELRAEFKRIYKIANNNKCFSKKDSVKLYIFILYPKLYIRISSLAVFLRKVRNKLKSGLKKLFLYKYL